MSEAQASNSFLVRQLLRQQIEIRELKRRQLNTMREGKVIEHHPDDPRKLKVDVGPEGSTVATPWIEYSERSGAVKTISRPSIGERVTVLSPDGELGQASRVILGGFSDENRHPDQAADGELIVAIGAAVARFHGAGLDVKGRLHVDGDFKAKGGDFSHNDIFVGDDHPHTNVMPGGGLSGPPAGAS
ncbi:phage baseplate assembly protein V [Shinella sp.]|uniref:phage baseplate assembly protein V n=1 Tax=Shinella sp. TaxID=1870904 RepID=UPI002586EA66|nr:phage baseplate assembly protein V [Shinella sp.]MCW5708674.1 phage baseplate assembly protein V [Shinella sp.]